ncbi:MAG TPA: hypothetical protein VL948_03615 [Verrucomicrobiae bacterium]|jgi:predicted  nucleic acid-binding Zn-ribbon protein|nr:hypothetical protein [Verrucomicrobiae bacterium]
MNVSEMTTTELEQLRQQLAHRAALGEQLDDDLTAVEDRLDQLRRQQERRQLAAVEAARRAEAEAAEEREAEAVRKAAQLRAALGGQMVAAAEVEKTVEHLVGALAPYLECGEVAYTASEGRLRRVRGSEQAATFISWKLSDLLPGHFTRPAHELRKPLREMLRGPEAL